MKYLFVRVTELSSFGPTSSFASSSAFEDISRFWAIDSIAVCDCTIEGRRAAGATGTPAAGDAGVRLKRHTKRTPWNLESWKRVIAAAQAASVR